MRAGLVTEAADWRWSSAYAHLRGVPDPLLSDDLPLGAPERGEAWARWLAEGLEEVLVQRLRRATATGRPLGSPSFLDSIGWVEDGA